MTSATTLRASLATALLLTLAAAPTWAQGDRGIEPAWANAGAGIVEVASPAGDPCADLSTPGCVQFDGNTVWHDGNVNNDYYVTAGGGEGEIVRLERYIQAATPDQFEIRFTADGGLGLYGFADSQILSVPFEVWNIGDPADALDDVRMIPFLNANAVQLTDWANQYTGVDTWPLGTGAAITDWIYGMMPDRPDGYDMFEAAAIGFGGAGSLYDPTTDGDTQIDPDPFLGGDCPSQGYYVDFCYRNQIFRNNGDAASSFIYPLGRVAFADLAGDGTTPASDTVVRFIPEAGIPSTTTADWADNGAGIVETVNPDGDDPCVDPGTIGCEEFGGNTVWHDPDTDADYYLSAGGDPGDISRLRRYVEAAAPDAFEIRFTAIGGAAVYGFETAPFPIARVPFEIWNIGDPDSTGDEVRMIPFLVGNVAGSFVTDWEDNFTGMDFWALGGGTPITEWVYAMMPDTLNGYNQFQNDANTFFMAGMDYDPTLDDDDRVNIDPSTGLDCANQGVHVEYCYRNDVLTGTYAGGTAGATFVYPIGRLVFADLAGDGTTPVPGTVIRFYTEVGDAVPTANEPDGSEVPGTYTLNAVYPNPFRGNATVAYAVPAAGSARVAVYDVLGREVARLADGAHVPGTYRLTLDGTGLAAGLYVVVLEGEDGARVTQKVTILR